ncbi:shikimate dehydrogenase [Ilumatobacter sp.]|uniref:shikimate dehydrogenase n=1 Tax=Ilumatobacter sp. TaxID=1967498 RepID=UPI003B52AC00
MTRRVAAVIGSPVAHSLSPLIHQAGFDSVGVDWTYVAFDVGAGATSGALDAMRTLGLGGLSVTMPHKEAMAGAVDRLDPAARDLGSVNTVSWDGDDLVGSSTDGAGFVASLASDGVDVGGAHVAVIGAGGAGRSLVDALGRSGASRVTVINRSRERAQRAASLAPGAVVGEEGDVVGADVVVNATSLGMGATGPGGAWPCDPSLLGPSQVVVDLVYHPLRTPWLHAAARRGCRALDGLGMLVHQAALQQRIWLGDDAAVDVAAMRAAARAAL